MSMDPAELDRQQAAIQWFAIRVKSRCEKAVATAAHNKGFEEFLPIYQSRNRWSDRLREVELRSFRVMYSAD